MVRNINHATITHINSETNPPPPIINVVWKYLRHFLCTSLGVATLPILTKFEEVGQIKLLVIWFSGNF